MSEIRHWFIQKPIGHNKPHNDNIAVFQEFKPTVSMQGFEWVKVIGADDLQKSIGKNLTHYISLRAEVKKLEQENQKLKKDIEDLIELGTDQVVTERIVKLKALLDLAIGDEGLGKYSPKNKWEECRSDGNIFDTVEGDPIWCFNDDDCGYSARATREEILKQLGNSEAQIKTS